MKGRQRVYVREEKIYGRVGSRGDGREGREGGREGGMITECRNLRGEGVEGEGKEWGVRMGVKKWME